jgi:hypothetical protein
MVDFSGHVSKAARITRPGTCPSTKPTKILLTPPDPVKKQKRESTPSCETPSSPPLHNVIQYEFIDESTSIMMSPTLTPPFDAPPSPISPLRSPEPALSLLLKAAHEEELRPSAAIPTPPQSPPEEYAPQQQRIPEQNGISPPHPRLTLPPRQNNPTQLSAVYPKLARKRKKRDTDNGKR